ncbi:MAG: cyclopropane fatty-acyl-phospholipid synthase-like methyltransferase [Cyclobacteriaceae bacterium]
MGERFHFFTCGLLLMQRDDYRFLTPVYDSLVKFVFGNSLLEATIHYFPEIRIGSNVLVVGGGSGQLLSYLSGNYEVSYLDKSASMMNRAKMNGSHAVKFFREDFMRFEPQQKYDIVIFPFVLDSFDGEVLEEVLDRTKQLLTEDGHTFVTDFEPGKNRSQKLLIMTMIIFFRWTTDLKIKGLQSIQDVLVAKGFELKKSKLWRKGLIFSSIYKRGKP